MQNFRDMATDYVGNERECSNGNSNKRGARRLITTKSHAIASISAVRSGPLLFLKVFVAEQAVFNFESRRCRTLPHKQHQRKKNIF